MASLPYSLCHDCTANLVGMARMPYPPTICKDYSELLLIKYYSTKAGDIIAQSIDKYNFKVSNYVSNNEKKESVEAFSNKTYYTLD